MKGEKLATRKLTFFYYCIYSSTSSLPHSSQVLHYNSTTLGLMVYFQMISYNIDFIQQTLQTQQREEKKKRSSVLPNFMILEDTNSLSLS